MGSPVQILAGHVLDQLTTLPANSVQTCITSPPYWGLRAYGTAPQTWPDGWVGELGLEPTPQLYVEHLVQVFREVRRVLRPDGTLWLNLGDSMAAGKTGRDDNDAVTRARFDEHGHGGGVKLQAKGNTGKARKRPEGLKPKDLVGIPWMVAFALRDDGWYLRSDIIWAKSVSGQKEHTGQIRTAMKKAGLSADTIHRVLAHMEPYVGTCMPESVRDRPTKSHEYLFLLTKSLKAYCQMGEVKEPSSGNAHPRGHGVNPKAVGVQPGTNHQNESWSRAVTQTVAARNRRSVWQISPKPYKGAHFATFPPELVEPCVLAGTSLKGQCPECGAPWRPVYRKAWKASPEELRAVGADSAGEYHGTAQKEYSAGLAQDPSAVKARIIAGMGPKEATYVPGCTCLVPNPHAATGNAEVRHDGGTRVRAPKGAGGGNVLATVTQATGEYASACSHALEPVPQIVLDPFGGSGTVAEVALRHGRRVVLVELNPQYMPLIEQRLSKVQKAK